MRAYRIGSKRFSGSAAEAFSGRGSLEGDGRWHHRGRLVVYAAQHASLATLEILVHLVRAREASPYVMYEIDVPDDKIGAAVDLPVDWRSNIELSRSYGDRWLASMTAAALRVPSAIVPSEFNLVLNPAHSDFSLKWVVKGPEEVVFDDRLIGRSPPT